MRTFFSGWSEPDSGAKLPDFEAWLFSFLPGLLWAIFASTSLLLNGAYVKGFLAGSERKSQFKHSQWCLAYRKLSVNLSCCH